MSNLIIEHLKPSDLCPYARNAKRHDPAQISKLCGSIREFGFNNPVLIDADNGIIAGHGRVLAAQSLGLEKIPCIRLGHLTDTQRRAYILADNRLAEIGGGWDEEMLKLELADLAALDVDVAEIGFGAEDLADLEIEDEAETSDAEPQIDKAEELRAKWGVEPGQLWELGDHRLLCGDSRLKKSTEVLMGGGVADMVITDPPYGVAYVGKTKDALKVENDDVDEKTLAEMCKDWFDRADEVSRDGAYWVATVPAGPLHGVFFFDWKQRGILRQVMVWNKDSMVLGHSEYHYKHEPILFGWKPGDRLKNADRTKTTVWDFPRPKASREHPTMKPVEMWCYAIQNHTRPKDTVYDPFSGSGTTIIACEQLGRKARAIEISPAYCAVAIERWSTATGKTPRRIS
ncbi:MAG: site-specific DNA-methyltransferase [Verrucomicrobia bacterium]|nr:site-specific DNA-methyltransferase [Verrucomicrobiota bacterium]